MEKTKSLQPEEIFNIVQKLTNFKAAVDEKKELPDFKKFMFLILDIARSYNNSEKLARFDKISSKTIEAIASTELSDCSIFGWCVLGQFLIEVGNGLIEDFLSITVGDFIDKEGEV